MFLLLALLAVPANDTIVIRVNQVGYLPAAPKVAVACALDSAATLDRFVVRDERGRAVTKPRAAAPAGAFGPCARTWRIDFSSLKTAGRYTIDAGPVRSPTITIGRHVYDGAADTLLHYMREQRSGWNPFFRDSVHTFDGYVIDDTGGVVKYQPVSGGWADASDYLQYVATSATATYDMLAAYRDYPRAFGDAFEANGLPGANRSADVLDEARHGIEWLMRMFPSDTELYNQLADDRDHRYFDLPTNDSSDYGWGKGKQRPIYPCTGRPQGIFKYKNRSTGMASTAGKFASAFALAARTLGRGDDSLARVLRHKAIAAYVLGQDHPGVCQTAPGTAPYFYEEDNWTDDMELAAAELFALTHESHYLKDALHYARQEPVTPWMGADTARHYEWYPWYNAGHYSLWRSGGSAARDTTARFYRRGLEAVARRADNGFRVGIPFIWCSNDLMVSFATQAFLYRRMTGDARFREYEQAAIDWLFGTNPWGTSMIVGYPEGGTWPHDPHSAIAPRYGPRALTGGLVDGPVYRSIFSNLKGIGLHHADAFAPFNTGFIVYHDDIGDYSTNEPIMDGTANFTYLLAALATSPLYGQPAR
ncbi:MAG TPA: glycoside hydrolase family 9 protein [Gemmatimonadaceae bacterium]|nr:glycoside hydrolase family 9 protein [Gemmatimonadaceae bacterium]